MNQEGHKDYWLIGLVISLMAVLGLFRLYIGPNILGDTLSYVDTMDVLAGHAAPAGFVPNRVITTFAPMEIVHFLAPYFGGVYGPWFALNCLFFVLIGIVFFKLLDSFFDSKPAAYLGTLFLATNYGFLIFGPNYLMDIGGWSFYIFSIYFLWRYARSKRHKDILLAALMVGVGGLFKEYAFLGAIAIAAYLILEAWPSLRTVQGWREFIVKSVSSAIVALVPVVLLYVWAYHRFGYTYANWFGSNAVHYIYPSRVKEYIKAFGSLINFLAFPVLGGAWIALRQWTGKAIPGLTREAKIFSTAFLVSFLPIFFWPAITQRILTITVPFAAFVACFCFKKYQHRWYLFLPLLALYALATFFMDSYILKAVNLPF